MCCAVKRVLLLLLLLVAAIGSNAAPSAEECEGLTKLLPAKDLHKIFGDWVLVWAVADHQQAWDILPNVLSSYVALRLLPPDNKTVEFKEWNLYLNNTCPTWNINFSMPADPSDSNPHSLPTESATAEIDGVVKPYNDSGAIDVLESCSDCLVLIYKNINGRFLMTYRREGQHLDAEQLKAATDGRGKQAECLGIPHDRPFVYNGVADFCNKRQQDS